MIGNFRHHVASTYCSYSRKKKIALWVAVIGLFLSILAAVIPSSRHKTQFEWPSEALVNDAEDGSNGLVGSSFFPSRHGVESLMIRFPCDSNENLLERRRLFSTMRSPEDGSGFHLIMDSSRLESYVGYTAIGSVPIASLCNVEVAVESQEILRVKDKSNQVEFQLPRKYQMSGLFVHKSLIDPQGATLRVWATTYAYAYGFTTFSGFAFLLSFASLLLLLFVSWTETRGTRLLGLRTRSRFCPISAGLLLLLVVWCIVGPVSVDDGWVIQTAEHPKLWTNFFVMRSAWDTRVITAFASSAVYWILTRLTTETVLLRLFPLFAILISWNVILRMFRSMRPSTNKVELLFLGLVFSLWSTSWLVTFRAEPLIVPLTLFALVLTKSMLENPRTGRSIQLGFVVGLAMTLHPAGIVAASPILASVPEIIRVSRSRRSFEQLFIAAVVGFTSYATITFASWSIWDLRETASLWDGYIRKSWRSELERYEFLFSGSVWDSVSRRLSILLALLGLILVVINIAANRGGRHLAGKSLLVSFLLLSLTPTKWSWHFGVLAGFATISLIQELSLWLSGTRRERLARNVIASVVTCGLGAIVWVSPDKWGLLAFTQESPSWRDFLKRVLSSPATWLILTLVLVALAATFTRKVHAGVEIASRVLFAVSLGLTILVPLAVMTQDSIGNKEWSIGRQSIDALLDHGGCGLADSAIIGNPREATELSVAMFARNPAVPLVGQPKVMSSLLQVNSNPVLNVVENKDDESLIASAWYHLPVKDPNIFLDIDDQFAATGNRLYLQFARRGPIRTVEWTSRIVGNSPFRTMTDPVTSNGRVLIDIGQPIELVGKQLVRIVVKIGNSESARRHSRVGPLMASQRRGLVEIVQAEKLTIAMDPFFRMYFPCLKDMQLGDGVNQAPDLIIGTIPFGATSAYSFVDDDREVLRINDDWSKFLAKSNTADNRPPIFFVLKGERIPSQWNQGGLPLIIEEDARGSWRQDW